MEKILHKPLPNWIRAGIIAAILTPVLLLVYHDLLGSKSLFRRERLFKSMIHLGMDKTRTVQLLTRHGYAINGDTTGSSALSVALNERESVILSAVNLVGKLKYYGYESARIEFDQLARVKTISFERYAIGK